MKPGEQINMPLDSKLEYIPTNSIKFIKLHKHYNNTSIKTIVYINAAKIQSIYRGDKYTMVYFSSVDYERTIETPEQIIKLINES